MTEVYVLCRQIGDRNLLVDVYRDREDAIEYAKSSSDDDADTYTVDGVFVADAGDMRCLVHPIELQ